MPSLFSRARTTSSAKRDLGASTPPGGLDEFGRVAASRSAGTTGKRTGRSGGGSGDGSGRARTISTARGETPDVDFLNSLPDNSFLPLNLDPPRSDDTEDPTHLSPAPKPRAHDYGYLSHKRYVVLGLEEVDRLVNVLCDELGQRGLTTPFVFSAMAMDVSAPATRRLIDAFLYSCGRRDSATDRVWRDEARLAGPHELGMTLRWGLARVVRIMSGNEVRGLVDHDFYCEWRDAEVVMNYPPNHFEAFLPPLHPLVRSILLNLFGLLSRLVAHSTSSGHTPPSLSPLFGPLLFGLGPAALSFRHTYVHYLKSVHAAEHLLLSFVRWQDTQPPGVPTRLKDWIRTYPAPLPSSSRSDVPQPRRGARTIRVLSVRRNVRFYTPDLVKSSASWARPGNALATSRDWLRIALESFPPRYSDSFRKRMDLPAGFHPDVGHSARSMSTAPSASSSLSSSTASTLVDDKDFIKDNDFKSLTDLKWGEFETIGFSGLGNADEKLKFDLTESARASRAAKRQTMSWDDFSNAGFSRTDEPLTATLQFSQPITTTISTWPTQQEEIRRKLKKTHKALPPFGWDTEPVMASEEFVEEAFVDVFCDLVWGGGWMDLERGEEIDRECNWALVEFKSLPVTRQPVAPGSDPRTASSVILFEEFVPSEYRTALVSNGTSRRKLGFLSLSSRNKAWKQATTLNGRPYVPGTVPNSPSIREVEFEGLIRGNQSVTRTLTPTPRTTTVASQFATLPLPPPPPPMPKTPSLSEGAIPRPPRPTMITRTSNFSDFPVTPIGTGTAPASPASPGSAKRASRFRIPVSPLAGPGTPNKRGMTPAEAEMLDFETRLEMPDGEGHSSKDKRRSRDDAWVDILVANHDRRMGSQDVDPALLHPGRRGLKGGRSDPELASQEAAAVLAAVRNYPPSDDEDNGIEALSIVDDYPHRQSQDDDEAALRPSGHLRFPADDRSFRRSMETYETSLTPDTDRTPSDATGGQDDDADSYEPPSQLEALRKRVGMGYFDVHPDRRRANVYDDPRARLAEGESDEDRVDGGSSEGGGPYGDLETVPKQDMRIEVASPTTPTAPLRVLPPGPRPDPARTVSPTPQSSLARSISPQAVPLVRAISPQGQSLAREASPGAPAVADIARSSSAGEGVSKTASLINMFREKERGRTLPPGGSYTNSGPMPTNGTGTSRLPVRAATQPALDTAVPKSTLTPPIQTDSGRASPSSLASSSPLTPRAPSPQRESPEDDPLDPPGKIFDDRRANPSPQRYVHGAPLQNVIEEEEEEE